MISRRMALGGVAWILFTGSAVRVCFGAAAPIGQPYQILAPAQPVAEPDRLEVIEFFWYGCPYCFELQPLLESWLRHKPADIAFRRIPAVRSEKWEAHVRIFYALTELGALELLHQKVYEAYHVDGLPLSQPEGILQWAARHGIDREKWLAVYASPRVAEGVNAAREATARYQVPGTPSFVVDGRYLTSGAHTGSVPRLMPVLDELIRIARADRARA